MKRFEHACIVDTIYTLLVYLLITDDAQIEKTYFFVGEGLPQAVRERLPHYHFFRKTKWRFNHASLFVFVRLMKPLRWPFLRHCKIFALDHLAYAPFLIGHRKYTYLEDAPYIYTIYKRSPKFQRDSAFLPSRTLRNRLLRMMGGPVFRAEEGMNRLCQRVVVSTDDYSDSRPGKMIDVVSLPQLWAASSAFKKGFILSLFNITEPELDALKTKSTILLAERFVVDHVLTEEEFIELYRNIINQEDVESLVIKTHPREKTDFRKYFPNIYVLSAPIPFQLLSIMGIRFQRAVTISSTSVSSFDYPLDIKVYGTSIHPKIMQTYGLLEYKDLVRS